jgi:hypothetical protein
MSWLKRLILGQGRDYPIVDNTRIMKVDDTAYLSQQLPVLAVKPDRAPELFINGVTYPIVQLSYQYLTNGVETTGVNMLIAEYMDGDKVKHIMIDNVTGRTTYGNEYFLESPRNSGKKAIDELVKRGFTKLQALEAYQCLCNLS